MFRRLRNWWKRIGLALKLVVVAAELAALYLVVCLLVVPLAGPGLLSAQLSDVLGRTVRVERVRFNPFTLEVAVEGLAIQEAGVGAPSAKSGAASGGTGQSANAPGGAQAQPFVHLGALRVNVSALSSIGRLAVVAETVRLESPAVHVVRQAPNVYNFTDILDRLAGPPAAASPAPGNATVPTAGTNATASGPGGSGAPGAPETPVAVAFPVVVRDFAIVNGTVRFDDNPLGAVHAVTSLDLRVPFTSGLDADREKFVEPRLDMVVDGHPVELTGRTLPFHESLRTEFRLDVKDLDLAAYWDYAPVRTPARLSSGRFSCDLRLNLSRGPGLLPLLDVSGTVGLADFALTGPDGAPFAGFAALGVPLENFSLERREVRLGQVTLTGPFARLRRFGDGRLDVLGYLPGAGAESPENGVADALDAATDDGSGAVATSGISGPAAEQTFLITLAGLGIEGLRVDFADAATPEPFAAAYVADVHTGPLRSDLAGTVDFAVRVTGPQQERVAVSGGLDLAGLNSGGAAAVRGGGNCTVAGVSVARYRPYYGAAAPMDVAAGTLDASGGWALGPREGDADAAGDVPVVRFAGGLTLAGLRLADRATGHDLARLGKLALRGVDLTSAPLVVSVQSVEADKAEYRDAARDRVLASLARLGVRSAAFAASSDLEGAEPGAQVRVASISLRGAVLRDPENFREFATLADAQAGSLRVVLDPLDVRLDLLRLEGAALEDNRADRRVAALAGLRVERTEVRRAKSDSPLDVRVRAVLLDKPEADFVVGADGVMNLSRALAPFGGNATAANATAAGPVPEAAASASAEPAAASGAAVAADPAAAGPTVSLGSLRLERGRVSFTDETLNPAYVTRVEGMHAVLNGLSTEPGERADFAFNATVDGHAPLRADGWVAAGDGRVSTDIGVHLANLEMNGLSAYTRKYIAYPLATGKLRADVRLQLDGPALDLDNRLLLEQLTLGEKVRSPDAPSLPIQLGLALLTDSAGNIDLDVPVSGRLDDPSFGLGKVIFGAIVNLFTKIVTAPFALLGNLFGGGEETGFLIFAPGDAVLAASEAAKLDDVAAALAKRPRLRVEVVGFVDAEADRAALAERFFQLKIKRRKLLRMGAKAEGLDAAQVAYTPEEYPELLTEAYENAEFERPRNAVGVLKDQPVEVMESMLRAHVEVSDDDLLALARARAEAAQAHLLGAAVDAGRVFQRAPDLAPPKAHPELAASRVELLLR
ncbi:MAG: DUF748 domain-containing protein [Desulfovibrionaceae bacterium]|jgi:uncharacterized protein involved in outer membrane biogenesis|nr:DUF748 domain-containing protein [Desulfovibrionaceae bacterium]